MEGAVRTLVVVVFAERFEQFAGLSEVSELVLVEALVAELRFARNDEAVDHLAFVRPAVQGEPGKLRAVVGDDALRTAAQFANPVDHADNAVARQRAVGLDPQALGYSRRRS